MARDYNYYSVLARANIAGIRESVADVYAAYGGDDWTDAGGAYISTLQNMREFAAFMCRLYLGLYEQSFDFDAWYAELIDRW